MTCSPSIYTPYRFRLCYATARIFVFCLLLLGHVCRVQACALDYLFLRRGVVSAPCSCACHIGRACASCHIVAACRTRCGNGVEGIAARRVVARCAVSRRSAEPLRMVAKRLDASCSSALRRSCRTVEGGEAAQCPVNGRPGAWVVSMFETPEKWCACRHVKSRRVSGRFAETVLDMRCVALRWHIYAFVPSRY